MSLKKPLTAITTALSPMKNLTRASKDSTSKQTRPLKLNPGRLIRSLTCTPVWLQDKGKNTTLEKRNVRLLPSLMLRSPNVLTM